MPAADAAGDQLHRVQAEGEQDGFLEPLVHDPLALDLLRNSRVAGIERGDRRIDGLADLASGLGSDRIALVPRLFDNPLQAQSFGLRHDALEPFADSRSRTHRRSALS